MLKKKVALSKELHQNLRLIFFSFLLSIIVFLTTVNIIRFTQKPQLSIIDPQPNVLSYTLDSDLLSKIKFWKNFLGKNPNYYQGWLELSKIQKELGDIPASEEALKKAYSIDPNLEAQ